MNDDILPVPSPPPESSDSFGQPENPPRWLNEPPKASRASSRPLAGAFKRPPRVIVSAQPKRRARHITRRSFVAGSAAALAAAAAGTEFVLNSGGPVPAAFTSHDSTTSTTSAGGVDHNSASLVLCTMYGGNDGLNTVVPYNDSAYLSGRSNIGFKADQVIPLDSNLGLHPSLKGFKTLWDAGQLAIIQGIGYPDPNMSHFRSMDIWQSAVPNTDVSTGWIGRWMDATGTDPLKAVSVGNLLPMALTGERALGAAVPTSPMLLPGTAQAQKSFTTLCTPTKGEAPILAAIALSGADMLRVQSTVTSALSQADPYASTSSAAGSASAAGPTRSGASDGGLASQLDIVNKLITAGSPTKVYAVSQASYDTHADEVATQAKLLSELDGAVTSFVNQMASDPKGQHSVVVMYSEFGRRVQSNASGGTDHGAASVAFVAGPKVKGGYYGEYPSLTKLDPYGNLVFNTDFRSVYATVLAHVIGEDPKVALNGSFPQLQFV